MLSRLPPLWSWGCFELRLGTGETRVDLSICATRDEGGQEAMAAALAAGSDWQLAGAVRPVLEEWARPGTLLFNAVPTIWLEYDMPDGSPQPPFMFLTLMEPSGIVPDRKPAELTGIFRSALHLLPDRGDDAARLAQVERCARALPAGGSILHLAALPAWRQTQALRVNAGFPAGSLRGWLERLGWTGSPRQWQIAAELFGEDGRRCVQTSVDVDEDGLAPGLTLEDSISSPARPEERTFLRRLVERGLCEPDKEEAVLAWVGEETVQLPDADWLIRVSRKLSIKVMVDAEGCASVKAYLLFHARYTLF
ncbi:MAG TPA: hypothetical protein VF179_09450 [Thermoanaerobaculia bacterium]|nr:hypothetical protein [Thermoanaerobaculia bacterium]